MQAVAHRRAGGPMSEQTINDFITKHGVTTTVVARIENQVTDGWPHTRYTIRLKGPHGTTLIAYRQGTDLTDEPSSAEVLGALRDDALAWRNAEDEADFAVEFGYLDGKTGDELRAGLRRARDAFNGCRRSYLQLSSALGEHLDELLNQTTDA